MPSTTDCSASCRRWRPSTRSWSRRSRRPSVSAARRSAPSARCAMKCRCSAWATPSMRTICVPSTAACRTASAYRVATCSAAALRSSTAANPSSTAWPSACATRTANWCAAPRAATAVPAKTSPAMCAPFAMCRSSCWVRAGRRCWRYAVRCSCPSPVSRSSTHARPRAAARPSPTRVTPLPAACVSSTRRSLPAARWSSAAMALVRSAASCRAPRWPCCSSSRPGAYPSVAN